MRIRACLTGLVMVLVTTAVVALSVGLRAEAADRDGASPIEQALIERACSTAASGALGSDRHEECLQTRLVSLRADFGNDLSKLSGAERRKIDSACGPIRASRGREAYLDCLGQQLAVIQARLSRSRAATSETPAPAVASIDAPVATPVPPARNLTATSYLIWLAVTLTTAGTAALVVLQLTRLRRARRVCKVCGTRVGESGDLCPACRHVAAETLRSAATERAERQRAQEDQERRQRERDEEQRLQQAREAEDERLRQEELARRTDEAAHGPDDETRRHAEAAEPPRRAAADEEDVVFDPYAILGVAKDTSPDAIRVAYEQAKSKYDLEQVADLGFEVKQHYIARAEAVDRAFQMLADVG